MKNSCGLYVLVVTLCPNDPLFPLTEKAAEDHGAICRAAVAFHSGDLEVLDVRHVLRAVWSHHSETQQRFSGAGFGLYGKNENMDRVGRVYEREYVDADRPHLVLLKRREHGGSPGWIHRRRHVLVLAGAGLAGQGVQEVGDTPEAFLLSTRNLVPTRSDVHVYRVCSRAWREGAVSGAGCGAGNEQRCAVCWLRTWNKRAVCERQWASGIIATCSCFSKLLSGIRFGSL